MLPVYGKSIELNRATFKRQKNMFFKKCSYISHQTLWCDNTLESSLRDDSNEWSHHKVWARYKKDAVMGTPCMHYPVHTLAWGYNIGTTDPI